MKLLYRVQHTAGRDVALARLMERLPPAEVITDHETDDLNPFRNYLRCLAPPPLPVTHLCVIQDDAVPCLNFGPRVIAAINERPFDVLSLFVGGLTGRTRKDFWGAQTRGEHWSPVYFRETHHVVALVWPTPLAAEFLAWWASEPRIPGPKVQRSDDAVVTHWIKSTYANRNTRRNVWATVPCLVEHPDDLPSVVQSARRLGDKGRRAIAFADDVG
jgi:hypothetical protein